MLQRLSSQLRRLVFIGVLLFTTVGCDQVTKAFVRDSMSFSDQFTYLGGMIKLQRAENPGAFLSLGSGMSEGARYAVFTVAVSVFLIGVLWMLVRGRQMGTWTTTAFTLILGGGVGNLIDRVMRGTVTDFVNLGIGPVRTGIFNVADVAIVIGVALLFLFSFVKEPEAKSA